MPKENFDLCSGKRFIKIIQLEQNIQLQLLEMIFMHFEYRSIYVYASVKCKWNKFTVDKDVGPFSDINEDKLQNTSTYILFYFDVLNKKLRRRSSKFSKDKCKI